MPPPLTSCLVAVIGAGPAGLVAARELQGEGHSVVVFERETQIGGTWVYTPQVESDPLSLSPGRNRIHSSIYASLRTNLPREVMGFSNFPFAAKCDDEMRDQRRFPGHREVLLYLQEFSREFMIEEMVRFETEVVNVGLVEGTKKWKVRSRKRRGESDSDDFEDEVFDAVVVCCGHYSEPRIAEIPGSTSWPGKQIHSHNYRAPDLFKDQVVILIGNSASAIDISRDIAGVAKQVHVASRSVAQETYQKQPGYDKMWLHSMIEGCYEDGSVVFRNGRTIAADTILHCTGYKYHFPFLETNGIVTVDDNRVGPLYKHIFPPALAPGLSFVGLPWMLVPFPMFEFQSKWIAAVLSGRIMLPCPEEMMGDVRTFYHTLESSNIPKRYTHYLGWGDSQFDYNNWFAAQIGCRDYEEWRKQIYLATKKNRTVRPETYRDEWDDDEDHLILEACSDFAK